MGRICSFPPHKLVVCTLLSQEDLLSPVRNVLENKFGPIDYQSSLIPFDFTNYYEKEMGKDLNRCFFSLQTLVDPSTLAQIKIETNRIEESFGVDGNRRVNLDPGLLALSRFVLATTKESGHRIPLRDGIWGELTLLYMKKDFQPLPWTYPDYATRAYRDILLTIRALYREQLKHLDR
ncbi:MAG: DUF4416 family protein [Spirochaetes bacterium]|nr:DUF4416 family protein [Spirochaetota bacterium]